MPKVKKTNIIPRRILKSDFQKVGVTDQDAVHFDRDNNFTAEVSDAAAKHLTERDAFEVVEEESRSSSETRTKSSSSASSEKK